MKKSKFLQNSKDMLSRSFNPTKCKTSLRLAISRLKLLRNKKEVQVNQMKREIAQLLETGQDQTAKIRVEHVIREEKMMGAYDLLEIYCELIIARLPIIETQKNCPIDMKEAIASIVFASPRCGDVPELLDVRKQFSAKYGKEFISAAIELRPQCGVSRLLVEKLSATAPDGQTKIKILSAIAEGHNVKWDPKAFDEKHSGGTSSDKKENELYSDPPHFEATEVHAHSSSNMNSSHVNSVQQDVKSSIGTGNLPPARTSSASTTFEPKVGPTGEEMPYKVTHNNHPNGQKWNMEFKDAASAAQAAAESAERASYAARAAAELSSYGRISGQYSTESPKSDAYNLKDDGLETPPNLNSFERISEASVNKPSSEYARLGDEHIDRIKHSSSVTSTRSDIGGCGGPEEYSQAVSSKSKASAEDDTYHSVPLEHEYTQEKSSKEVSEPQMVVKKQSSSYETENENGWSEKVENLREGLIKEQKSSSLSYSQSGISDYVNIFANSEEQKFEEDIGESPSVSFSETDIHDEAPHTSSHDFVATTFDYSDTDNDGPVFDGGPVYDEHDLEFQLHSLGQNSPNQTITYTDLWNPRSSSKNTAEPVSPPLFTREESPPDVSENAMLQEDSELDNFPAVRFDDSDRPSSESDDEDRNTSVVEDYRNPPYQQLEEETTQSVGLSSKNEGPSAFVGEKIVLSSDDEFSSSDETHWNRSQLMFHDDSPEKLGGLKASSKDSQIELNNIGNEFDTEIGEGLNFGKLTGGFRHKGHNHLSFFKNGLDISSSVKKEEETAAAHTSSTHPSLVEHPNTGMTPEYKMTSKTEDLHSESDDHSSEEEEEYLQKKQPRSAATVKTKLILGSSNPVFGSDDSDLDEHSPRESVTRKSHLRGGISRRTKAHPSSTTTTSNSKMHLRSEALDSDVGEIKPTTSYTTEAPKRQESYTGNSSTEEKHEKPISGVNSVPAKSNTWGSTEVSNSLQTYVLEQESKERINSKAYDSDNSMGKHKEFQPLSGKSSRLGKSEQQIPAQLTANSSSWGTSENPTSSEKAASNIVQNPKVPQKSSAIKEMAKPQEEADENPKKPSIVDKHSLSKDDSTKKASHVHPKLPDYDALVQSLRNNRS